MDVFVYYLFHILYVQYITFLIQKYMLFGAYLNIRWKTSIIQDPALGAH
jgi:hypothetical protein